MSGQNWWTQKNDRERVAVHHTHNEKTNHKQKYAQLIHIQYEQY